MYIVKNAKFHNGQEISRHRSLKEAMKSALKNRCTECQCGGPEIVGAPANILMSYDYYRMCHSMKSTEAITEAINNPL